MVALSELTLVRATPEQEADASKRTFVQWSRGMRMEEYLERDKILAQQEHARGGKFIAWVLTPRTDPTTLNYFCSCETFRRAGVMAKPGQSQAQSVTCYGIASVFTPAYNRGKGYASHMMRLLHWVLAPIDTLPSFPSDWGAPPPDGLHDAQFSALYSDIGSEFYENCGIVPQEKTGWKMTGPVSTFWKVNQDEGSQLAIFNSSEWFHLTKQEAEEVWERDSRLMASDVVSASKRTGKVAFTFLPNAGVGGYSIQRTMTFTPNLEPVLDKYWGLIRRSGGGEAQSSIDSFVTWAHEPATTTMVLTRIRVSSQDFPQMLQRLKEVAKAAGKDTIEAWNVPDDLNGSGGQVVIRDEHLPAVKWYGPEEQEQPLWLFNEKFCWC